jgi:hypothetical protein
MCGVVAMTVLDLSVVNVALPSIQTDLDAKPADLRWVGVIYGVLVAGFLMLGGRTGDVLGHRRVLVIGVGGHGRILTCRWACRLARAVACGPRGTGLRCRAGGTQRAGDPVPDFEEGPERHSKADFRNRLAAKAASPPTSLPLLPRCGSDSLGGLTRVCPTGWQE